MTSTFIDTLLEKEISSEEKLDIHDALKKTDRQLTFSEIRNFLDRKTDDRTINLYDDILRERLKTLPDTSHEERSVTYAYILKNILKRKRFFVEARVIQYFDALEYHLASHWSLTASKISRGRTAKSRAIHATTGIAFISIAIDMLGQVESAFRERGFNTMTKRAYVLKNDYYTDLIALKSLWGEWIFRVIWKITSLYGVGLKRLLATTFYFLGLFTSLFYITGNIFPGYLGAQGKAVGNIKLATLDGAGNVVSIVHPMLYNYNQANDIFFHYALLTTKLMAFRVETGFVAVTLIEKGIMLSAEVI